MSKLMDPLQNVLHISKGHITDFILSTRVSYINTFSFYNAKSWILDSK